MKHAAAVRTLVESFNALADEVQSLVDRKTILEHKLRYAHEQVRGCESHMHISVFSECIWRLASFVRAPPRSSGCKQLPLFRRNAIPT